MRIASLRESVTPDETDITPEDDAGLLEDHYSSENDDNRYPFSDGGTSIIGSRGGREGLGVKYVMILVTSP